MGYTIIFVLGVRTLYSKQYDDKMALVGGNKIERKGIKSIDPA